MSTLQKLVSTQKAFPTLCWVRWSVWLRGAQTTHTQEKESSGCVGRGADGDVSAASSSCFTDRHTNTHFGSHTRNAPVTHSWLHRVRQTWGHRAALKAGTHRRCITRWRTSQRHWDRILINPVNELCCSCVSPSPQGWGSICRFFLLFFFYFQCFHSEHNKQERHHIPGIILFCCIIIFIENEIINILFVVLWNRPPLSGICLIRLCTSKNTVSVLL